MMGCHSLASVSTENPSRIRSAKPEWEKLQARFIKSLSIENELGEKSITTSTTQISSARSFPHFGHHKITEEGDKIFSFGSDVTGSPDNYVCRQRYLRSYVFTREEESSDKRNIDDNNHKYCIILKKAKRWLEVKKKGMEGKAKGKSDITYPRSCSDTYCCFKFLSRCLAKVQVQNIGPTA